MSREVCEHGELIEGLCPQCLEMGKAYRESLPKYTTADLAAAEAAAYKRGMMRAVEISERFHYTPGARKAIKEEAEKP